MGIRSRLRSGQRQLARGPRLEPQELSGQRFRSMVKIRCLQQILPFGCIQKQHISPVINAIKRRTDDAANDLVDVSSRMTKSASERCLRKLLAGQNIRKKATKTARGHSATVAETHRITCKGSLSDQAKDMGLSDEELWKTRQKVVIDPSRTKLPSKGMNRAQQRVTRQRKTKRRADPTATSSLAVTDGGVSDEMWQGVTNKLKELSARVSLLERMVWRDSTNDD